MENEKRNGTPEGAPQDGKKHRPHHKRGYFIDPAQPSKEQAAPTPIHEAAGQKPRQSAQPKADRPDGQPPHPKKKHKRHRSGGGASRPKEGAPASEQTTEQQESRQDGKAQDNRQQAPRNDRNRPQSNQKKERSGPAGEKTDRSQGRRGDQKNRSTDRLVMMPKQDNRRHMEPINDDEYEEIRFPAPDAVPDALPAQEPKEEAPSVMVEVVGIRFKSSGKVYYFAPGKHVLKRGEYAIVETARGQEYGEVAMGNSMVKESDTVPPLRPILRPATEADRAHHAENKKKEEESFRVCNEKIAAHGLDMKLIDAQYTFDNSKLLFYFTSSGRVDFRDLVKDLASVFRTRIELRQIGIRDEAKLMGGMGMCGRPLCCSLFLTDFGQVSIKMAKEQNLSLNSAKISGICGRLMCCLRYEHETYEYEIKRTPPVDALVRTADGNGTVTEANPLVGTVKVRLLASPEQPPKLYRRQDVVMLKKKNKQAKADKTNHEEGQEG